MKEQLIRAFKQQQLIHMIYMAKDGSITKPRVKILKLSSNTFQAYCFTRKAKRTFLIDQVLAVIPIVQFERQVI